MDQIQMERVGFRHDAKMLPSENEDYVRCSHASFIHEDIKALAQLCYHHLATVMVQYQ